MSGNLLAYFRTGGAVQSDAALTPDNCLVIGERSRFSRWHANYLRVRLAPASIHSLVGAYLKMMQDPMTATCTRSSGMARLWMRSGGLTPLTSFTASRQWTPRATFVSTSSSEHSLRHFMSLSLAKHCYHRIKSMLICRLRLGWAQVWDEILRLCNHSGWQADLGLQWRPRGLGALCRVGHAVRAA